MTPRIAFRRIGVLFALSCCATTPAAGPKPPAGTAAVPLVGYTGLRTNLTGGRHANARTMRAAVVRADGTGRQLLAEDSAKDPDTWTQFAGWSPDGKAAIIGVGWQSSENAKWEEENKRFRMDEGKWKLDSCLLDLASGKVVNVTGVERVSHYNGGLFFLSEGRGLGFTPLIKGVSKPHVMDLDGRNKRDVSGRGTGPPRDRSITSSENGLMRAGRFPAFKVDSE
jgi:TolB protein